MHSPTVPPFRQVVRLPTTRRASFRSTQERLYRLRLLSFCGTKHRPGDDLQIRCDAVERGLHLEDSNGRSDSGAEAEIAPADSKFAELEPRFEETRFAASLAFWHEQRVLLSCAPLSLRYKQNRRAPESRLLRRWIEDRHLAVVLAAWKIVNA